MKNWKVVFEIFGGKKNETRTINVEAGNKKLAMTRAMMAINKIPELNGLFKKVIRIEEAA